jgi:RNA polymerase sigma factor (sigma-70 family)
MFADTEALAARLARREAGADEEFVRTFAGRVERMLRGRLRDPEGAREVANDVLLAVLGAVSAGRLQEPSKLPAFVMGTARNLANGYRRRRSRRPVEESLTGDEWAGGAAAAEERERRRVVFDRIYELDDFDRSIVGLTLAQGLKPAEIARALHLSPLVVRARKCRAIRRLAAHLGTAAARTQPA